ncbi:MAG: helix-turn-helix domain-containing protein [Polyangiaceae bacterium]|nr:helix-turn-helix domain-containing protein [Polyangiaceae bacterium]
MRKLTPAVVAEIRRLRAQGRTQLEIARELGLSKGTIGNALGTRAKPAPAAPLAPPEPAPELGLEDEEPADLDTQLAWLSRVAGQRRQDADRLRAAGDDAGAARATSDALKAAALLARHTQRPEQAGRYVTDEQIAQAAAECRNRLRTLIEHARAEKGSP